eukprot:457292-Hanusia_phi.AAC.1
MTKNIAILLVALPLLVSAASASGTGLCDPCRSDAEQGCSCPLDQLLLDGYCCDCSVSSTAMLQPALHVEGDGSNVSVLISVWNVSNHSATRCRGGDASCEAFSVFYTLDGSAPTSSSFIACADGQWQGDRCMRTWQDFRLRMWASARVRVIAVKQVGLACRVAAC